MSIQHVGISNLRSSPCRSVLWSFPCLYYLQVDDLVVRVGLPTIMAGRAAGTLSGGNKRKAVLAMALCGGPAVVLLDEPSSGEGPVLTVESKDPD